MASLLEKYIRFQYIFFFAGMLPARVGYINTRCYRVLSFFGNTWCALRGYRLSAASHRGLPPSHLHLQKINFLFYAQIRVWHRSWITMLRPCLSWNIKCEREAKKIFHSTWCNFFSPKSCLIWNMFNIWGHFSTASTFNVFRITNILNCLTNSCFMRNKYCN